MFKRAFSRNLGAHFSLMPSSHVCSSLFPLPSFADRQRDKHHGQKLRVGVERLSIKDEVVSFYDDSLLLLVQLRHC